MLLRETLSLVQRCGLLSVGGDFRLHSDCVMPGLCADLLGQLGSADHGGRIVHQHADDSAQALIRLMLGRPRDRRSARSSN